MHKLQSKGLNAISKPSSGLVGFKLKSESDDLVIELTVKQSEFSRVKQMFDSLTEEEIKNWSNSKLRLFQIDRKRFELIYFRVVIVPLSMRRSLDLLSRM